MNESVGADQTRLDTVSQGFVGQWNRLVSSTNWEKGRIIHEWREALAAADAPVTDYSDEAWSQQVGGVSSQHVGRLRRVWQRFAAVREEYPNLYWSHFQAALDWEDAEMWLEGAVRNGWSISQMRDQRSEVLGVVAGDPADDRSPGEWDEDEANTALAETTPSDTVVWDESALTRFDGEDQLPDAPHFGSQQGEYSGEDDPSSRDAAPHEEQEPPQTPAALFSSLGDMPDDVAEAVESMKLAILRHKQSGWSEYSRSDMLAALAALRQYALAPSTIEQN